MYLLYVLYLLICHEVFHSLYDPVTWNISLYEFSYWYEEHLYFVLISNVLQEYINGP